MQQIILTVYLNVTLVNHFINFEIWLLFSL